MGVLDKVSHGHFTALVAVGLHREEKPQREAFVPGGAVLGASSVCPWTDITSPVTAAGRDRPRL